MNPGLTLFILLAASPGGTNEPSLQSWISKTICIRLLRILYSTYEQYIVTQCHTDTHTHIYMYIYMYIYYIYIHILYRIEHITLHHVAAEHMQPWTLKPLKPRKNPWRPSDGSNSVRRGLSSSLSKWLWERGVYEQRAGDSRGNTLW